MHPGLRLLLVCLAVGLAAFGATRWVWSPGPDPDGIGWMHREFHLSDVQMAEVTRVHEAYQPICRGHCDAIEKARQKVEALQRSNPAGAPILAQAQAELQRLIEVCNTATRKHLHEVAACLPEGDRSRFLDLTLPRVADRDHSLAHPHP